MKGQIVLNKIILAAALSIFACASLTENANATGYTFRFDGGPTVASGSFSFDDSLLGSVVNNTELTSFSFNVAGYSFGLDSLNNDLPTTIGFGPGFFFNSAIGNFVASPAGRFISHVIGGGTTGDFPRYVFFLNESITPPDIVLPGFPIPPPSFSVFIGQYDADFTGPGDYASTTAFSLGSVLVIDPTGIPEPATILVVLAGLLGLARLRSRIII